MTTVTLKVKDAKGGLSTAKTVTVNWQTASSSLLLGANYDTASTTDESLYQGRPKVARLYLTGGKLRSDIKTEANFTKAYNAGVRTFVVSWKDNNQTLLGQMLDSFPAGCTVYGVRNHEPENDMSAAAWKTAQAADMPVVRAHGAIPTCILMSYTLNPASGRNLTDWKCPAGTFDVRGFDYYPKKQSVSQATVEGWLAASATTLGIPRLLVGEYGVPPAGSDSVSLIADFKAWLAANGGEVACYWSSDVEVFSTATANAWFS